MNKPHIYKITNNLNGKFYYGVHNGKQTKKYMGSGKLLKQAYKKHGKENFSKEILLLFDTAEEAYEYESIIVSQKIVDNPMCYNLRLGGDGANEISIAKLQKWKKDNPEEFSKNQSKNGRKGGKARIADKDSHVEMAKAGARATLEKYPNHINKMAKIGIASQIKNGTHMSQQRKKCIHCGCESVPGNISRWHNDNCRLKENNNKDNNKKEKTSEE